MVKDKSNNPISIRSRKWIIDALLELMKEKAYDKITIKEITDKADLVRKTFYRNFDSKDDVLYEYINELMKQVEKEFENDQSLTPYTMATKYFTFWSEHIHFLHLLQRNNLFIILLQHLDMYMPGLNGRYKANILDGFDALFLDYYTIFNSAGVWHMLERWVSGGAKETPEQLAQIYSDITLNNPHKKK
ncbi:TetR/AcrR family transcriptional regulator [Robertmurraya massiliosenegalensis]|uniref:TetR/AcrR family transcriptional regulator n=1 Tax=Robertmurraya massiliosenegalensis TaxID=1287657 RepID=UPI0002F2D149|nr:TetR/AcrR family transcriptional regulator [Robertmurraya massiliosenegalensis]